MENRNFGIFCGLLLALCLPQIAFGAPAVKTTLQSLNSECKVISTSGRYPSYRVYQGNRLIYAPESDGITKALISPQGNYVALSAGEVSLLDIEKGKFEYGVVIINCKTGTLKGFRKGQPSLIKKWWANETGLDIWEGLNFKENMLP